jgi:hypothetical protein
VSGAAPPLRPLGLVLRRDGSWLHQGQGFRNRKLRELFDRSVRYLPAEQKYVVQVGRFQGEIELEEAGFFVREVDLRRGTIRLSDDTSEALDAGSIRRSPIDGAWLCKVKRDLAPGGLDARFSHAAHAELLDGVKETDSGPALRLAGALHPLPADL